MTKSSTRSDAVILPAQSPSLRNKLMFAASAGILAMVAPSGFYGMRAGAQANVPIGCDDDVSNDPNITNDNDNVIDDGETIECEGSPVLDISPIEATVADLTINIGSNNQPSQSTIIGGPNTNTSAISMTGSGAQSLEIRRGGSVINNAAGSVNPTVNIETEGSISLTNRGVIDNQSTLTGGSGEIAVRTKVKQGGGDLVIDSTDGRVLGGVYVYSYGNGKVDLDFGEITSTSGDEGLYVYPI